MARKISFSAGIGIVIAVTLLQRQAGAQADLYPDTLWMPVTFYDYFVDANSTNPDFEIANSSNTSGMVANSLDNQKKPIPTALACPSPISNPPAACHLAEWFRVSGSAGSDNSLLFVGDSTNKQAQKWYWTTASGGPLSPYPGGQPGEFVGPNFSNTYDMRNIIIYDTLPFIHLGRQNPAQIGVYEFARAEFFWLDGRGFGTQPPQTTTAHNFGFTMELHSAFTYKAGLTFTFTGDDDTWTFINGRRVIDLGGRHGPATATINLDTMPGFVEGQRYPIDFFYAERHTTGSAIRITSNIIAAQPSNLRLVVSENSACPGEPVRITGQLLDNRGLAYPALSDSISWSISPSTKKPGDTLSPPKNDTTWFTSGFDSLRTVEVIGSYRLDTQTITNTARIYIRNCSNLPSLTSATTRDLNGNGYIDHIDMVFSGEINLDSTMLAGFLVKGNGYVFQPIGISMISDSIFRLNLREDTTSFPQTAWTPDLSINLRSRVRPTVNFPTRDGCPPVVWSVKKFVVDAANRSHDSVVITMSEKVKNATGGALSRDIPPSEVFNTWVLSGRTYVRVDTLLNGISAFTNIFSDSIFVIIMTNGKDITTDNFFNVREERNNLRDAPGNFPDSTNQKVKVSIGGIVFRIIIGPNPARPTLLHADPMAFKHEPNAVVWAKAGQGVVISLQNLTRPQLPEDAQNVKGSIKIIDVVGNTVNWAETSDLFSTIPNAGGTAPALDLYWNGLNREGMPVAPGVYRVVVYINYPSRSKIADSRVITKVGIKR